PALIAEIVSGTNRLGNSFSNSVRADSIAAVDPSVWTTSELTGSRASVTADMSTAGQIALSTIDLRPAPSPKPVPMATTLAPRSHRPIAGVCATSLHSATPGRYD